ncbi:hypothetical protein GCM10007425_30730 [Lysinibacillus alkalisoli]|uniref:Uncharacterized protein n=1 Tax=Lysinibacillus alkalisoli TaxID=1911548 RepID=A0A917GAE2_9BACI|nr:hypothetical protein [Lysinibacillus alkalisoli]GGG33887.1 hypothetical protein GCM10007425_30730 [Lysinibacillus alkalisoli]
MLQTLLENGKKIGLFQVRNLKDLDTNNRIEAKVEVIDFDAIKCDIFKGFNKHSLGFDELKSCDGLKIIPEKKRLDFIELKGIEEFCFRHEDLSEEDATTAIYEQIDKFNLNDKIFHSLCILTIIFQIKQIALTKKQKKQFSDEITSEFIVVVDSKKDEAKGIGLMLETLANNSDIKDQYLITLRETLQGIEVLNIKNPKLMFQEEIDYYYHENMAQ